MTAPALDQIVLLSGSHKEPAESCDNPEGCLFEWYSWLTSGRHTDDRPADVSPVLHIYGIRLNDALSDDRRQELRRHLPQPGRPSPLAGTYNDGLDEARSYVALDWLVRTYAPAWLDLAGLTTEAAALRDLSRIADLGAAQAADPVVRNARDKAYAARAGRAARWDAPTIATQAAVSDAAGIAAQGAVWVAGGSGWTVAGAGALSAARDAAQSVAQDSAWDAAGDAVWAAARDRLAPTVDVLQTSAIALYDAMIHPTL